MSKHDVFSRRDILAGGLAFTAAASLPGLPPARANARFALKPAPATINIVGEKWPDTAVWAYNGTVPGPELRLKQGERLTVDVTNGLDQPTTVHWHGLRLPNAMDGVPELTQEAIEPGQSFTYDFDAVDAGTFWYHPHFNTPEQVGRGLHGALIVEEPNPPQVDRDLAWVIDDWRFQRDASIDDSFGAGMDISHGGRSGNTVTVNGRLMETFTVRSGERLRLRLINAANARIFGLRFDGLSPTVIALDGQPVTPHAPDKGLVVLGPGMRADLIIDCSGDPGSTAGLTDVYYGRDGYTFAKVRYSDDAPLRTSPLDAPIALAANPVSEPDLNNAKRHTVVLEGGAMGNMRGAIYKGQQMPIRDLVQHMKMWAINGVASHGMTMDPILTLKRGQTYVFTIRNDTGWPHPMHMHGHVFRVLSNGGKPVLHTPMVDTVLVERGNSADIAFVADNPGDWLFHCHVLEHALGGMSSVIRVA